MNSTFKYRLHPKSLCAGTALLLLAGSPAFAVTDLVTNGGFEMNAGNGQLGSTTSATDWTVTPYPGSYAFLWNAPGGVTTADTTGAPGVFTGPPNPVRLWGPANGSSNSLTVSPNGGAFIGSNPAFHNGPISQTLTGLNPNLPIVVTFDWAGAQQFGFSGPTDEDWKVSLGGQSFDTTPVSIGSHGFSGWMQASFTFAAPHSTSEVLSFMATGTHDETLPPFALLDGVSAREVPEPSTWVMMGLGFAGLAYAGFRSNRRRLAWTD